MNHFLLGYWPSSLFLVLSNSASKVQGGGEVINKQIGGQHTTTQMSSGHFIEESPNMASFFRNLKVINGQQVLRDPSNNHRVVMKPNCYNLLNREDFFYFGGPGRSLDCP